MQRLKKFFFSLLIFLFAFSCFLFAEESLTITTYYPSPYGSYSELSTTGNTYLATAGGNVGIGTATPQVKLDVAGTSAALGSPKIAVTGSGLNSYMTIGFGYLNPTYPATKPPAEIGFYNTNDGGRTKGDLIFATRDVTTDTAATERMRIKSDGSVGIGTAGPAHSLHIKRTEGSAFTTPLVKIEAGSANEDASLTFLAEGQALTMGLDTSKTNNLFTISRSTALGTDDMMVLDQTNGNVGIGTAIPATVLEVSRSVNGIATARVSNPSSFALRGAGVELSIMGSTLGRVSQDLPGGYQMLFNNFYNGATGGFKFTTAVGDALTIGNAGNVGIGTVSPTAKLEVNGTIKATKVTTGIVDPIYDIKGVKYATYGLSSIGIREEMKGLVRLKSRLSHTIDFAKAKAGSDAWLFWNVIGKKISNISVILTPAFNGNVWYTKKKNSITFFATHPGEVSFQLSAPRFDAQKWPNVTEDNVEGMKIE